ncbi:GNAT family N-acetyltransferase [Flavisolibacter sp. BT320]|nr:GNAT family N-acetyltransferase [Flavisolibacter longurius]
MILREAKTADIIEMHRVRVSVNENRLSDPGRISENDYREYITERGKGWVCEVEGGLVGFAVVDEKENNIWALFVHPDFENKGIGKRLHHTMLSWHFKQSNDPLWLGTSPGTRAEIFYKKMGWQKAGFYGKDEVKFEITKEAWMKQEHLP